MQTIKAAISAISIAVLSACGSSGTTPTAALTYTGQFYDAPSQGLAYIATPSGKTGTTDSAGNFYFAAGDTVAFSITSPNGSISIGSIQPPIPPNSSTPVIVPVLSLSSGVVAAQVLQSLGGTGPTINVAGSLDALSSQQISNIQSFISSGGATARPAQITVSANDAQSNALTVLASLSPQTPTNTLSSYINDQVVFAISNATAISDTLNANLKSMDSGLYYLKSDGTINQICVNNLVTGTLGGAVYSGQGNNCSTAGVQVRSSIWQVPSGNNNVLRVTNAANSSITNTITFPLINAQYGALSNVKTLPGFTSIQENGIYNFLQASFGIASLAGKKLSVSGNDSCSNGLQLIQFDSTGANYSYTCQTGRSDGGPNIATQGTANNVTNMPGIVAILDTVANSKPTYIGLQAGGSVNNGNLAVVVQGKSTCGVSGIFSPTDCGHAALQKVTSL